MAVTPEPGTMAGTCREVVAPEQKPGGLGRGHRTLEPAPERRAGGWPWGAVVPRSACACVEPGPLPGPVFPSVPQGRLLPFCPAGPSLPRALPSIRFSTERCPGTRPTLSSVTLRCSSPSPQVSLTWPSLHVAMPVLGALGCSAPSAGGVPGSLLYCHGWHFRVLEPLPEVSQLSALGQESPPLVP